MWQLQSNDTRIVKRTIFESAGFIFGMILGINIGFIMAFMYLVMPFGVP
jgi:hypothetical protein